MSNPPRKYTNFILELVDDETLDKRQLIRDLLCWMSEAEVEEFAKANMIGPEGIEEEEESD